MGRAERIGGQPYARRRAIDDLEHQRLRPAIGRKRILDGDHGRGIGGKRRWRNAVSQTQRNGKYKIFHRRHFPVSIIECGRTKNVDTACRQTCHLGDCPLSSADSIGGRNTLTKRLAFRSCWLQNQTIQCVRRFFAYPMLALPTHRGSRPI